MMDGYLALTRGGCHHRWHSLASCDHGDSMNMVLVQGAAVAELAGSVRRDAEARADAEHRAWLSWCDEQQRAAAEATAAHAEQRQADAERWQAEAEAVEQQL
jgi:hypothetical protein